MKPRLIIFDLDGTLIQNKLFYSNVYSKSLTSLVEKEKGKEGLKVLSYCRTSYQGRGELCLLALNIPYKKWAKNLDKLPLDLIKKDIKLVNRIKDVSAIKIIYTGSPLLLTKRLLKKVGFKQNDFNEIIAWEQSEEFPLKWTCSPMVYHYLLTKYAVSKKDALVIGDNRITDINPAKKLGIPHKLVRKLIFDTMSL